MPKDTKVKLSDVNHHLKEYISVFNLIPSSNPTAIFVTGISGSGKSSLISKINGNFIKIQSDNYRKLHPNIKELTEKMGKDEAYKRTGNYSFEFAKALRMRAIEHKLNAIFEATFSKVGTANELIKPFLENGYQVVIVKLPVDVSLSVNRNIARYEKKKSQEYTIPRITSREDIEKMAMGYEITLSEMKKCGVEIIDKSDLPKFLSTQQKIEFSNRLKEGLNIANEKIIEQKKHSLNKTLKMKM